MDSQLQITEKRAKIMKKLKKGQKSIRNIYWDIGTTWHNCQYHLKQLQKQGLVKGDKRERTTVWNLTDKGYEILQMYE